MFVPLQEHSPKQPSPLDTNGLRYKQFEIALARILSRGIYPCFHKIPPRPDDCWPWNVLPPAARVLVPSSHSNDNKRILRAQRKEWQLQSILQCIHAMLPKEETMSRRKRSYTIVDFAGGSGHLSIPLALLYPNCEIVVVDLKASSLRLVHQKALQFGNGSTQVDHDVNNSNACGYPANTLDATQHDRIKRSCQGIPNLYTFHGSIEVFTDKFDLGVSLHACGEASDLVLRSCARHKAPVIVAPCCVGKLNRQVHNPYVFHATGDNCPTITYPQSNAFRSIIPCAEWDAIAKAADYSEWDEMRSSRNATRRAAKAVLEMDRLLFLQENFHYKTALVRMDPWEASPKHDIILAWREMTSTIPVSSSGWSPFKEFPLVQDDACNADIHTAYKYLFESNSLQLGSTDWSKEELQAIEKELQCFIESDRCQYRFPTRMGGRKRKLIHYVAHQRGLLHWPEGDKDADKIVVVAKPMG